MPGGVFYMPIADDLHQIKRLGADRTFVTGGIYIGLEAAIPTIAGKHDEYTRLLDWLQSN